MFDFSPITHTKKEKTIFDSIYFKFASEAKSAESAVVTKGGAVKKWREKNTKYKIHSRSSNDWQFHREEDESVSVHTWWKAVYLYRRSGSSGFRPISGEQVGTSEL